MNFILSYSIYFIIFFAKAYVPKGPINASANDEKYVEACQSK